MTISRRSDLISDLITDLTKEEKTITKDKNDVEIYDDDEIKETFFRKCATSFF